MSEKRVNLSSSSQDSRYIKREKWAFIVGISQYQDKSINLNYAHRDAEELYKLLQTPSGGNFLPDKIRKLTNEQATTFKIDRELKNFLDEPGQDDIVLLYFSCHGAPDPYKPNQVYLITHDTNPNKIALTGFHMEDIDKYIKRYLLSERLIILADTCHSEAIKGNKIGFPKNPSEHTDAEAMNRYLEEISKAREGVAILTSAAKDEVSLEDVKWGDGHGVFTHYLLEGMRGQAADNQGFVRIGNLFQYVSKKVQVDTQYKQHPLIVSKGDLNLPLAIVHSFNSQLLKNLDITIKVELTDQERLVATKERILTEQGSIVFIIPAGVTLGQRLCVKGKGKLDSITKRRGDLYLLITKREEEIIIVDEKASNFSEDLGNGITLDMVYIQAGSFIMGSNQNQREQPIHQVELKEFYISKYPITQAQYHVIMGKNPSHFQGENNPVECVTWYNAQEFCQKLSTKTGKQYRLPSEAQWEYACRAGSRGKWCFGNDESQLKYYAWYCDNSNKQTHPVGQKEPNQWGIYDMHGNVWEWCEDDSVDNYKTTPIDGSFHTKQNSIYKIIRGGSFRSDPYCRSAYRDRYYARDGIRSLIGFRVVHVLPKGY